MQEKLVIYLHADDLSHPSWAVVDAQGYVRQSAYRDSPDGLAAIADQKEVMVLVPAEDVLLAQTRLPKMSRARLVAALPYALEEQLIADVDTLHFAPGHAQADGDLPVAVVAHEKMQQWLALLQDWHVNPNVMLPVSLALPYTDNVWSIFLADLAIMRTGLFQGYATDINNLRATMDLALASAALHLPSLIHIHNYTAKTYAASLELPVPVEENRLAPERMIADLAGNAMTKPGLNLLRGRYARKKSQFPQMKKMLQMAAYLAVAWVFLLFFYPLVSYFILKQRLNDVDTQVAQIYKANFPDSKNLVAPKMRMEEKLQKLDAQIGANRLLLLLGYVGKGLNASKSISLKRYEFQNSQLTLELSAASSEDFAAFTDFLSQQGLNAKQQNVSLSDDHVNATLVIE